MATNDRTAEEAEEALRADIASVTDVPDVPVEPEVPVASEPEKYEVSKVTAKEAIGYIRSCENVSELYDLIQAEEKDRARKTVITEGMSRIQELNILKETAREQALAPELDVPDLKDATTETSEIKAEATPVAVPPPVVEEIDEYPIEDSEWDGEMGRYTEIKHISRTMHPMGGVDERVMSPKRLNEYLEEHFAEGFELIKVLPQGFGRDGVSILYVLGKVKPELEASHNNIWHIQRTLTERPMVSGGVTGFQADNYLNSFLSEGWQLFAVDTLKDGEAEIPMLWVLVR